jgi:hypothetical protein
VLALLDDRQRVQRRLGDVSGGVVHRSSCRLDPVVSMWLDVDRPKSGRRVSDGHVERIGR